MGTPNRTSRYLTAAMPLRLRIVNIFLASLLFVYLEHRFKLLNLNQYVQQLNSDYLMNKNPQTQLQMESLFEKFQTRYWQRFSRVKEVCEKYHLVGSEDELNKSELTGGVKSSDTIAENFSRMQKSANLPPEKTIMHLAKYSLLYSWIHKAASSSWNKIFFQLVGKTKVKEHNLHEAAAFFRPPASQLSNLVTSSLLFMVVRHPFERLVSAFRDKFEIGNKADYIYKLYAAPILQIKAESKAVESLMVRKANRPTFIQFIDYLLRTEVKEYNDHWRPYWLHCNVCRLDYDVFVKFETISEDTSVIEELSGLSKENLVFPWTNRMNSGGSNKTLEYFQPLGRDRMHKLFQIFQIDFE